MKERLLWPTLGRDRCSWAEALAVIAERFKDTIDTWGRESVGFYVSGQLLTEDYYVVNKFVKGWLGTANVDTNSRLCMASSVAGHKRAFGSDTVPGCYEDLIEADLVLLVGSNLAWCHPVLFQRLSEAKAARPKMQIVLVDPRRTVTAELADTHLAIEPGSDTALFNGLLRALKLRGMIDHDFVGQHVKGFDETLAAASEMTIPVVADRTGISTAELDTFYENFSVTQRVVTVYSQGVNQSICGTDKVNSIINCHLATGRIGRPGMGPFAITGQPNAMGGREVGGLANMLAAHMEIDNPEHRNTVQQFWQSPHIASSMGLKAVDLFQAVKQGKIKALWIMASNPADSMPEADKVSEAIQFCPFVVVSDVSTKTDTVALADVTLPAQAWSEKDGTVTNSERTISRQRRWRQPVGVLAETRPDWWAVAEVAKRISADTAFEYTGPAAIFREFAALSGSENHGTRDFDISACADISDNDYEELTPFQWPWVRGDKPTVSRFFASGGFYTEDRCARMIPIRNAPSSERNNARPLILNTGRIRDQWHTMTRTGLSARLSSHYSEPFVEINPNDARAQGIDDADLVDVNSERGHVRLRALIDSRQRPGSVFAPMHWSKQYSSAARVCCLINSRVDPHSGQPDLKAEAVAISKHRASAYGFCISSVELDISDARELSYWARAHCAGGERIEIASEQLSPKELGQWWRVMATQHFPGLAVEEVYFYDAQNSFIRCALFAGSKLLTAFFTSSTPVCVSRVWASEQLTHRFEQPKLRWSLLAAKSASDIPDKGSVVCSCFGIGSEQIKHAIIHESCCDIDSLGDYLKAGTNCGSCRSELGILVRKYSSSATPETNAKQQNSHSRELKSEPSFLSG